ncbi:bifunctional [glutamate--ammonia ligase]-adenylyl-L-tyrosine phosphorylase/[glutamate--ammonia-ligase] adenylyltransferase [Bordetella bronchiseptica]|uniref:bifunctional [glutamate--ammonia ligase]-adenylyl-L-tyrosine phosphorylase/[glutamate--ammonia-ligase] adenylyltransferase n=1 Tax=Bordetella bronchiseptica TaxID=518 RepID=UPI00028F99D1|nr:bifunctional [glutamate--ammonia ligase]-adenylyl-L-tyrosine phosphorylase/[glutamate--ammonia-ligase] adenylyltransferase [Bordetella bronchiseptica]KCV26903.1 [glutamate--ammonia-ligase] adenylyltransferase [Bordetella bronchiseptica 00-P-2730]KAK51277.1 [glutamate--ammonia-ligase] adenylyltransferase [Bordetella bronchiseptica OSU054]KAK72941.1 [glutamate--ammonia-ligase] adenylyltransferase [Bordetella bronchiseptica MO211]KDB75932.1 [glutamate--ammonia-ligase] adenylyltransferase [Borde
MSSAPPFAAALAWSGHLRRRLDAHPDLAAWLANACAHPVSANVLAAWQAELSGPDAPEVLPVEQCRGMLRKLRERVFLTLIVRDLGGQADLEEVVGAMTVLADIAVGTAYRSVAAELAAVHGLPREQSTGDPQEMLIVGMGKLGGRELNVSSDIDLVMLYGDEGETDGPRRISNHEFYGRLTRRMMPVLSEVDADGQVFRTDLRLRPDGDAGPLAWSLDALEHYLIGQGREWERYAWLKARLMPAQAFADSNPDAQARQLESLRVPFVYRKYFDFDALAALRALRERIRQDWQRRALARNGVDSANNIKLGDGGIREIEFIVQLSQLIRGGRMPALQRRGLLEALHAERAAGLVPEGDAQKLEAAYRFLRRTEHALQYREDEQTHLLPADPAQRAALAAALGYEPAAFERTLAEHRAFVSQTFRNAFRLAGMGEEDDSPAPARTHANGHAMRPHAGALHDIEERLAGQIQRDFPEHAEDLLRRTETLLGSHRVRSLPDSSRHRLEALLPAALTAAAQTSAPMDAALRLFDLIETIAQRSAYLALLAEYPDTLARVARMVAASPWAAQYLTQHPLLLDSLIDWRTLFEPLDFAQVARQLAADLDACRLPDGEPDIERQMNLMRDVQRQASFQLLAQDLEGELTVEKLADQLSALADLLLAETIRRVWPLVNRRPGAEPHLAVIAYGKLGGKELGYASDLDLVFLFDDDREDAAELYAKLGRRMTSWLSTMTSSGRLYEVDLRLRPDGDAGLLAVSLEAFEQYQRSHAWPWEHQALTRARYAAGDTEAGARFERIRADILVMPRDVQALRGEVLGMRDKISAGHPNRSELFDVKHDRGGMVDVEFVTQYLVLCHAATHRVLVNNLGNIALLRLAGEAGLIPAPLALAAGDAYRTLRRAQHQLRLKGVDKARVPPGQLAAERATVCELWQTVLQDGTIAQAEVK